MTENQPRSEVEVQVEFFARQVESRIVDGAPELLGTPERKWLRGLLADRGVDFDGIKVRGSEDGTEGLKPHAMQPTSLEKALGGRERMVVYCQAVLEEVALEKNRPGLAGKAKEYLSQHTADNGVISLDLDSGDLADARMVAIVSATHRLLRVLSVDDERALEIQSDKFTNQYLRERVLRRMEKDGVVIAPRDAEKGEVPRLVGNNKLRTLPKNGIEVIMRELMNLKKD